MGTRSLGSRPWLVVDERRRSELAMKAELLATRHDEVFAALPNTEAPARTVLALVSSEVAGLPATEGPPVIGPTGEHRHPLDDAGRLVQEDLCLLRREPSGWLLVAASLCFPSRWRLAAKLGLTLGPVHGPVAGYDNELAARVDRLLDRLDERIVWRRNWFIHPDGSLFQPDRPSSDPVAPAASCLWELYLRSERQTLRRIGADHVLFTIRIQQDQLRAFVATPERRSALARFVAEADPDLASHRGLSDRQREELGAALDGTDPAGRRGG